MTFPAPAAAPARPLETYLAAARDILAAAPPEGAAAPASTVPFPDLHWFPLSGEPEREGPSRRAV